MSGASKVIIDYGEHGLTFDMPDDANVTVLRPTFQSALSNAAQSLREALKNPIDAPPLGSMVNASDHVAIVFSDFTRPVPNRMVLPAVIESLPAMPDTHIHLFNATGTHRNNTPEELRGLLGEEIAGRFRVIQNNASDKSSYVKAGVTSGGNDIWLLREFLACDFCILTGSIEPHFFAGFSGGGKAVMPGLAALESIERNHSSRNLDHPNAAWGVTHGNPIWEEIQEASMMVDPDFLVNVSLNRDKAITGIFAGDISSAYAIGCEFVRNSVMAPVSDPFDIVITSNSGFPLDRNLYQAVKGMSAASRIVKRGGAIIIAAECRDGVPTGSPFENLLSLSGSPQKLLEMTDDPNFRHPESWQARILASIVRKAEVHLYSERLTDTEIRNAWLNPCHCIESELLQLMEKYGKDARVCVLPEGPVTVPYLSVSS